MGFKLFIVMVWLAVPAALGLMLQADRYRYEAVGAAERQVCLDRVDRLRYHASALRREAAELDRADDAASLQTWRITWNALQRNYTTELPPLAPGDLSHYPATAKVLDDQTTALQEMLDTVSTAARDHEFYLRSDEAVQDLNGQVEDLRWQAERYRQMGAEGIYLSLQELLAEAEGNLDHQEHERQRLQDSSRNSLSRAEHTGAEVLSALDSVTAQIGQDDKQTYKDAIRQRWATFDLKRALSEMLARLAGGQQSPATT